MKSKYVLFGNVIIIIVSIVAYFFMLFFLSFYLISCYFDGVSFLVMTQI